MNEAAKLLATDLEQLLERLRFEQALLVGAMARSVAVPPPYRAAIGTEALANIDRQEALLRRAQTVLTTLAQAAPSPHYSERMQYVTTALRELTSARKNWEVAAQPTKSKEDHEAFLPTAKRVRVWGGPSRESLMQTADEDSRFSCRLGYVCRLPKHTLAVFEFENVGRDLSTVSPTGSSRDVYWFETAYLFDGSRRYRVATDLLDEQGERWKQFLMPLGGFMPKEEKVLPNKRVFHLWFEELPATVGVVDVVLPYMQPFPSVAVEAARFERRVRTDRSNVDCELISLVRNGEGLELTCALHETAGIFTLLWPRYNNPTAPGSPRFRPGGSLIIAGSRVYKCPLDEPEPGEYRYSATEFQSTTAISSNSSLRFQVNYPTVPREVDAVTICVPSTEPFVLVPIQS